MVTTSNGILYVTHSSGVGKYANGVWSNITPFGTQNTFNALSVNRTNHNDVLVSLGDNI
jgi:xyloglucan-specific exo-beta-1,4-glucanase